MTVVFDRKATDDELRLIHDLLRQLPRSIVDGAAVRPFEVTAMGADINTILRVVTKLSGVGDVQLTILATALVIGCISTGVSRDTALGMLALIFEEPPAVIPLDTTEQ